MINFMTNIFLSYITSDLIMGTFHWIKDTYFNPKTPIIGKVLIEPSRMHHIKPSQILKFSNYELLKSSMIWTSFWYIPYVIINGISIYNIGIFTFICGNDVIHKYSHMNDENNL